MITKLLIANRGEIACRIIKTAKQLGISTVAIYSDADRGALHTIFADSAYYVGPSASSESYLNIETIIAAAKDAKVDAIHPGYGFLSENTQFAQACMDNNIIFIGPSIAAIKAMGSKITAKKIMEHAKVPLIPGYHGDDQDPDFLLQQAKKISFPIIIKAAAGGGGKGMRVVNNEKEFSEALAIVQREALAYFKDDKVLLEKYLNKPRHIEIQIFGDAHGNYVHLFERDCSIQRRHQKVVEEAPAPNLSTSLRESIAAAAVESAKAINYIGAGTVEFLVDSSEQFYFMEMNTRLQVEHPVTEMITGLDLVTWQIEVAEGKALPLKQNEIEKKGHALEVRLYAEDPYNEFLPSIGKITWLQWPTQQPPQLRIDTGFQQDDEVSPFYDPMLAKLIVWGQDREQAIVKMQHALRRLQIIGIKTNACFLLSLISHEKFINQEFDTGFIEKYKNQLFIKSEIINFEWLAKIALFHVSHSHTQQNNSTDIYSPWNTEDNWRMNLVREFEVVLNYRDVLYAIKLMPYPDYYNIHINQHSYKSKILNNSTNSITTEINNVIDTTTIISEKNGYIIFNEGEALFFELYDPLQASDVATHAHNSMTAPMPGTIIAIKIKKGETVESGTKLITLEAMKMEHSIYAPAKGIIKELLYKVGDMVSEGSELLIFEAEK